MKGSVISRDSNGVTIVLSHQPDDACSACGMGDSCSLPKTEKITLDFNDQTRDLMPDDVVDVEMTPRKIIGLSFIVYIIPLVFLLAGAIYGNNYSETAGIAGALVGLLAGLILNIFVDRRLKMSHIISIRRMNS